MSTKVGYTLTMIATSTASCGSEDFWTCPRCKSRHTVCRICGECEHCESCFCCTDQIERAQTSTGLSVQARILILASVTLGVVAALFCISPFAQDPSYHHFADNSIRLGVPHFGDVVSNLCFALVGILGLYRLRRLSRHTPRWSFPSLHLTLLFVSLVLVTIVSSYYHWNPSNTALFWDRLPITLVFMILFSMVVIERIATKAAMIWAMPVLVVAGGSALCYWIGSEFAGHGDLRPYVLVQLLPIVLTPLLLVLFPGPALLNGETLVPILLFYGAALLVAYGDQFIWRGSMGFVSGHSIKHVLAAIALLPLIRRVGTLEFFCIEHMPKFSCYT